MSEGKAFAQAARQRINAPSEAVVSEGWSGTTAEP